MKQSQYRHFPSHAREGAEAVVMPVGDRDHIRCFTDQVKLTRALVRDLDEAVKEVNLLGECDRTTSKMRGFVSQDHIGGFSLKRECANTHK
jgi:hypothetical protein